MAAGNVTVLDIALEKIARADFNFDTDVYSLVLVTKDQPLTAAFAGASGQALYSDLTNEVVGAGYTAGGAAMTDVSVSRTGSVVNISSPPITWPSASVTAKYGVICLDNGTGGPFDILAFFDLETTDPDGRSSNGGDLTINFASGLFTLTRA